MLGRSTKPEEKRKTKGRKNKEEEIIEVWDKKRLVIAFIVLGLIILALFFVFKPSHLLVLPADLTTTPPTQTQNNLPGKSLSSKQVQARVEALKQEVNSLNAQDLATQSPQVQKVMNDLQALQGYPKNQVKSTCAQICNGL